MSKLHSKSASCLDCILTMCTHAF